MKEAKNDERLELIFSLGSVVVNVENTKRRNSARVTAEHSGCVGILSSSLPSTVLNGAPAISALTKFLRLNILQVEEVGFQLE